jgi:hypothetical protein
MIQLGHVPDAVHRQLKARAALAGMSLSDYLVQEVRKIAPRPWSRYSYRHRHADIELLTWNLPPQPARAFIQRPTCGGSWKN